MSSGRNAIGIFDKEINHLFFLNLDGFWQSDFHASE
jgi:hypothetical protein